LTIYRDGCGKAGILNADTSPAEASETEPPRGLVVKTRDNLTGLKRKLTTGCGSLHFTAFFDPGTNEVQETYLSKGSNGGCNNYMTGVSRLISTAARAGVPTEVIADQLQSCGVCPSYAVRKATKNDTSAGACCAGAIGAALLSMKRQAAAGAKTGDAPETKLESSIICPECGGGVSFAGGCVQCFNCGWSKCE
jgi:ribonucleoside-diphosphate reductase alpha chain